MQRRALKPIIAAESNPEGAPAGGISALVYGIVQSLISNIKRNDTRVVPPQSSTNFLPFLSGSGEKARQQVAAAAQIPLDGIWLGAAGNSSTEYGYTQKSYHVKIET